MFKLLSIVAAGALAAGASAAVAAPSGKNADEIVLHCGSDDVTVVVNGGGFSPGHVVGTKKIFIPVSIATQGTFTPTQGDPQPINDLIEKGGSPANRELETCTFEQTFTESGGTAVVTGTVIGFFNR